MIAIILLTYERLEIALRTLVSLHHLKADEEFWLHVADDGSSPEYRDEIIAAARELFGNNVSATNSERRGYGGNYNYATQVVHGIADLVLPLEDDWEMVRDLHLGTIAAVLRKGIFSCVRLGYLGYTDDLRGTFRYHEGLHWLELDPESPEKHVFAGGPRLETVDFERSIGPWPEYLEQGQTELAVAGRKEARVGVAWPLELVAPQGNVFVHIGSQKAGSDQEGSRVAVESVN